MSRSRLDSEEDDKRKAGLMKDLANKAEEAANMQEQGQVYKITKPISSKYHVEPPTCHLRGKAGSKMGRAFQQSSEQANHQQLKQKNRILILTLMSTLHHQRKNKSWKPSDPSKGEKSQHRIPSSRQSQSSSATLCSNMGGEATN